MDYITRGRTNYFKVKDRDAFIAWIKTYNGVLRYAETDGSFCILAEDGFPSSRYDELKDEEEDVEIWFELIPHLIPGQVAILKQIGYEGLRSVDGWAQAVNSDGLVAMTTLNAIYDLAGAKLGIKPQEIDDAGY